MASARNPQPRLVSAAFGALWLLGGCMQSRAPAEADEAAPSGYAYPSSGTAARGAASGLLVVESLDGAMRVVERDGSLLAELPGFEDLADVGLSGLVEVQARGDHLLLSRVVTNGYGAYGGLPGLAQPPGSAVHYAMLLRRSDFELLWQRKSEPLQYGGLMQLGPTGHVSMDDTPFQSDIARTVIKAPGGEERVLQDVRPLSAPDEAGWLAVRSGSAAVVDGVHVFDYGFARAGERGLHLLSERHIADPLLPFEPLVEDGPSFHYLARASDGTMRLVHERPDAVERIALGAAPAGAPELQRGARSWLVSIHAPDGPQRPWVSANEAGDVIALSVPDARGVRALWPASGDWFYVLHGDVEPERGWLDAATSAWKATPVPPAGLRPWGSEYCDSSPAILDDGRVLLPLRDDEFGGVYQEDAAGAFTRVGAKIRDAIRVEVARTGQTLALQALHSSATYCQPPAWTPTEATDGVLLGGQTQFIRGDRSVVLDTLHDSASLDPTGRYVAAGTAGAAEGLTLHDLERGSAVPLPDVSHLIGWL